VGKKQKKIVQGNKAYYRKDRITIGMMEDFCKTVQNKKALIYVTDKDGLFPEPAIRSQLAKQNGKVEACALFGNFSFTELGDDDDEEGGVDVTGVDWTTQIPTEGKIPISVVQEAIRCALMSCAAQDVEVPENLPDGIEFLGEVKDDGGVVHNVPK
jgi:hypothetical protein